MSITFQLVDGTISLPRDVLGHSFFQKRNEYIETTYYEFDVTSSEFFVVIAYLTHGSLPPPGTFSNAIKAVCDFLTLDELSDFLRTDIEYFLQYIDPSDLQQIDSTDLIPANMAELHPAFSPVSTEFTRVNHPTFYASKPPNDNISHVTGMNIDWSVFIYHTEYPVRYMSGGVFYPIGNGNIETATELLLSSAGLNNISNEDDFIFFKKGIRRFRIARTPYPSIQAFIQSRNDCDAYFYGVNGDELGLWYTRRKIRFSTTHHNLYDPRFSEVRLPNAMVPIEFVGAYDRNRHLLPPFL